MTDLLPRTSPSPGFTPLGTVILGWKVILSEAAWSFFRLLRRWEIRQLRQRLDQEFVLFDRLASEPGPQTSMDLDLCRRQIDFLRDEIDYLEKELVQAREDFVRNRIRKWHLDAASPVTPATETPTHPKESS